MRKIFEGRCIRIRKIKILQVKWRKCKKNDKKGYPIDILFYQNLFNKYIVITYSPDNPTNP